MLTSTVLNERNDMNNSPWFHGIIEGRLVDAKVYNQPSSYGINGGRVSKLAVYKTTTRDCYEDWHSQLDYNYSRGEDFNNLPEGMLEKIVAYLEALPELYKADDK